MKNAQATDAASRPGRGSDKFPLRFPEGLRDQIKEAAAANNRTMNAEIVARLEASEAVNEKIADIEDSIGRLRRRYESLLDIRERPPRDDEVSIVRSGISAIKILQMLAAHGKSMDTEEVLGMLRDAFDPHSTRLQAEALEQLLRELYARREAHRNFATAEAVLARLKELIGGDEPSPPETPTADNDIPPSWKMSMREQRQIMEAMGQGNANVLHHIVDGDMDRAVETAKRDRKRRLEIWSRFSEKERSALRDAVLADDAKVMTALSAGQVPVAVAIAVRLARKADLAALDAPGDTKTPKRPRGVSK